MLDLIKDVLRVLYSECWVRRNFVLFAFIIISATIIGVGTIWPKEYSSRSTIVTEGKNILTPLLEGSAVTTNVNDHIKIAKQIIYSRETMGQLLREPFWNTDNLSPIQTETLIESIIANTKISNVGGKLIEIEYKSQDPEVAFLTTQTLTDIYLSKNQQHKQDESQSAFNFIDEQVQLYHQKLVNADKLLENFRKQNIGATPDSLLAVNQRLSMLMSNIEKTHMEIKEAQIVKQSLREQIQQELSDTSNDNEDELYQLRINRLQSYLDELRLKYHDSYPDVVNIKTQLLELKKSRDQASRENLQDNFGKNASSLVDDLRSHLAMTNTKVAQLKTRLEQTELIKAKEQALIEKINKVESELTEMRRDYAVNSEIYQKLLRQKETARVSMNIDLANQGATLRIQEHAALPLVPQGLRFSHFILAALLLGIALPVGVIYAVTAVDGQVRSSRELAEETALPVLGMVNYVSIPMDERRHHYWLALATLLLLSVLTLYAYISWMQLGIVL